MGPNALPCYPDRRSAMNERERDMVAAAVAEANKRRGKHKKSSLSELIAGKEIGMRLILKSLKAAIKELEYVSPMIPGDLGNLQIAITGLISRHSQDLEVLINEVLK